MTGRSPYSNKTGTSMVLGSQQAEIITQLMAAGIECRPWKERIYINGTGDVSIYLQLADPTQPAIGAPLHDGVRLHVWCNDKGLAPAHRVMRAKKIKHETWAMLHRLGLAPVEPPAEWNQVQL